MTTFQMLNHQLKHILGGIQAEKNASIQELENFQRKVVKAMEKAQSCHKKIYQAAAMMKANLAELSQNYMSLFRQGKYSGTLIGKVHNEINKFLQEICQESLSLSKKMEGKVESYVPNLKKIKQQYTQSAETFEHYKQKLELLKKSVEKQSLANIKQDEHQRFQRNKDKFRAAQKQHDQTLLKITKRFYQFNSEGLKDIFHDFISIISTIGGNALGIAHRLSKNVASNMTNKDLSMTKNLKNSSQSSQKTEAFQANSKKELNQSEGIFEKQEILIYLIQERQITNFIKSIMEREISKLQTSEKINEVFIKKQHIHKEVKSFDDFKNQYTSHHLKKPLNLQKMKQPDPIQISQDLLSVEQQSENGKKVTDQETLNNDIQFSFQQLELQRKKTQENEQKIKRNLERFNQICQESKINQGIATSNLKPGDKMKNFNLLPINNSNLKPAPIKKEQKTVQVHQFFNFTENQKKKDQKLSKPQQQLVKMHEHLFNFDVLSPPSVVEHKKSATNTVPSVNYNSSNLRVVTNPNSNPTNFFSNINQSFENFDFFGQEIKNHKGNTKNAAKTSEIKSSQGLPKGQKGNTISFDLLNF